MANNRYLWTIAVLVVIGWAAVALVGPNPGGGLLWEALAAGTLFGTMFGQAALGAIWCALGPLPLTQRLPLAVLWLATVSMAFGLNLAREAVLNGLIMFAMFGGILLLQWVLVQIPLWLLTARLKLRIIHESEALAEIYQAGQQFGIRHVLILTTLVAMVLGLGRLVLGRHNQEGGPGPPPAGVVIALTALPIFNAIYALTVTGASVLEKGRNLGVVLAIIAVGLLSLLEVTVLDLATTKSSNWHEHLMFVSFNLVQAMWIAVVLWLLRAGGYRLVRS
jgi:hypothetical protein